MSGSPRFTLNKTDVTKLGKGAVIAAGGTLVTYLVGLVLPDIKTNPELQSAVFVLSCVAVNAAWKLLTDTREKRMGP